MNSNAIQSGTENVKLYRNLLVTTFNAKPSSILEHLTSSRIGPG